MTKDEADELLALVERVSTAFWNMECACPGRSETEPAYNALDGLARRIQEMANGAALHEHDL